MEAQWEPVTNECAFLMVNSSWHVHDASAYGTNSHGCNATCTSLYTKLEKDRLEQITAEFSNLMSPTMEKFFIVSGKKIEVFFFLPTKVKHTHFALTPTGNKR